MITKALFSGFSGHALRQVHGGIQAWQDGNDYIMLSQEILTSADAENVPGIFATVVNPGVPGGPKPPSPAVDPPMPDPAPGPQPIEDPPAIPAEVPNPIGDPPPELPEPVGPGGRSPGVGALERGGIQRLHQCREREHKRIRCENR
jgi:hypothetical protein